MNTYCLTVRFSPAGGLPIEAVSDGYSDTHLLVSGVNLHPPLTVVEGDVVAVVWGNPIVDGRIDRHEAAKRVRPAAGRESAARSLNGSFVIFVYDRRARSLAVVNDRFASRGFYFRHQGGVFHGCSSFKRLFDAAGAGESATLDSRAIFEFLHFRRVFGTKTYDSSISFLPYASILTVANGGAPPAIASYWRPSFEKSPSGEEAFAEELAAALAASMRMHTSDGGRVGLMLSGGLDSRALLAASDARPVCFTTGPTENNEVAIARELARLADAEHVYIPRPKRFLDDMVDDSVFLGGGMTIYPEAQLAGYGGYVAPRADAVLLGLALDIMFCGHYLPKHPVRILGKSGWHFALRALPDDLAGAFADTVSYRLKTSDPFSVVRKGRRRDLRQSILDAVAEVMAEGRAAGAQGYDLWEFMHLHNFARHYSFHMAASVQTYADCRTPALENGLFDLCRAMPAAFKTNWRVYQKALVRLDPALMEVRNANTNIKARYPLRTQTWIRWARSASNAILRTGFAAAPSWWDRSWPHPRESIDANPRIREMVAALPRSDRLAAIDFLDMDAIAAAVGEHAAGGHDHTVLLNALVTIDRCLAPARGP